MVKKLIAVALIAFSAAMFAGSWYSSKEMLGDIKKAPRDSKDTLWYSYVPGYAWVRGVPERGVYVNVNNFGLEYPINLHAIDAYLYDPGYMYTYRVYDKDGVTMLWELDTPDTANADFYNIQEFASAMIMKDDFWISVVPLDGNYPRLVSSDVTDRDHSFYKDELGNWIPLEDEDGRYEWGIDFKLSPYDGEDTYAPMVRAVSGTEGFQNVPLNITAVIQDQSALTTVTGQYNIGAGWVDFPMTASKTTYYYTGTIPAQADGTAGSVRVYAEDSFTNSSTSAEYAVTWSKDYPLLLEKFEGSTFPPAGWTLENAYPEVTDGGFRQGIYNDNIYDDFMIWDGKQAFHNYADGDQDDWLITPKVTIPADNFSVLSFAQRVNWLTYMVYHGVAVSTDLVNWTEIYTGAPAADPSDPTGDLTIWENTVINLSAYNGQEIYIGFHYQGNYCTEWHIDDVSLIYDYSGPEIISLTGNQALLPVIGAYVNNPMDLTVLAKDLSGIASITGHYTLGAVTGDVVFAKAKGEETWTGSIPAMASAATGFIYFDMEDAGGMTTQTSNYDISFVTDTDDPVINYCTGTMTFLNLPMNLELSFKDESAIAQVNGHYSKDNWVSQYDFALTPSKIHEYMYAGTIPAEATEVYDGKVYFEILDAAGNTTTSPYYTVQWLDGQYSVSEDFESGTANWALTATWGLEEVTAVSPTHSLTESPDGNYGDNVSGMAMWATPMDWSDYLGASISFWCKFDLENGFDYTYFEGSGDNGMTWIRLKTFNGEGEPYNVEFIPLDAFVGMDQVVFRFMFVSDGGYTTNGMNIDDVKLITYNEDYGAPTIVSDPYAPEFYQGTFEAYTDAIEVSDISGVASVKVLYSVDGGAEQTVDAVNTTGKWYEFTIPQQVPGTQVDYRIQATDASSKSNVGYSSVYSYISGEHKVYDEGIVSYYMTAEDNAAWAERVTVDDGNPALGSYISTLLFRNYADGSGHISADMVVHVWADNGGLPGDELVTPFDVTPEASPSNTSAMTRVDMRGKMGPVYGDFWIGVSAPYGIVYSTMESTDETGGTAYQRSYKGTWNGTGWDWAQQALDNWHFRTVIGEKSGIEDVTVPTVTKLEQNYPNPFNPATTINFNLAKDSKVSLVVYDVMGREVANLVNGEMAKGSHKVSFDASSLVSGVYYYNLKAAGVNQTRKMMLIK
jgi:hypothetical protein